MGDAGLSAFSVFFLQSPSFLDYQRRMQKERGRNNASSLFGVHQIPSTQQIGNLLDPVAPAHLRRCSSTSSRPWRKPASWPHIESSTGACWWRSTAPSITAPRRSIARSA
jgi:hypothetical protein